MLVGVLPSLWAQAHARAGWRRWIVVLGLPLSIFLTLELHTVPPWSWMGLVAVLLAVYPLQAWRDAPLFPTPQQALLPLAAALPLGVGARILDAGSGLGHGMEALRRAYPRAHIEGVERSLALAMLGRWRCRKLSPSQGVGDHFHVRWGNMWSVSWGGFDMVYLFQRPETMDRAWHKAKSDLAEGGWVVSLEFPVPGVSANSVLQCSDGRALWVYRVSGPEDSIPGLRGR